MDVHPAQRQCRQRVGQPRRHQHPRRHHWLRHAQEGILPAVARVGLQRAHGGSHRQRPAR